MTEVGRRSLLVGTKNDHEVGGALNELDLLPSVPKLRGKCTVVTTRLCEAKLKSTNGLFDLSFPQEYLSFSSEYNSLHDPCLKSYFYRDDIKRKLVKNGFVTKDLYVRSSLKEYNEYRRFLENEFMKARKREDYDNEARKASRFHKRVKTEAEVEREQQRVEFFKQQERKLRRQQQKMRKMEREEEFLRLRKEEQKVLRKEQFEIQREAEREQRMLRHMKEEIVDEKNKRRKIRRTSELERQRILHLEEEKQKIRMKHAQEMEERWQRWEEHSQRVKEEEEERKRQEEEEKRKRMEKREKIFKILQSRDEERRKALAEQSHHEAEELKVEADKLEKLFKDKKDKELKDWKKKFERQRSCSVKWGNRSSRSSLISMEPSISQCSLSTSASKSGRQVRFQSKHVIIPGTINEDEMKPGNEELKTESVESVDLSDGEEEERPGSGAAYEEERSTEDGSPAEQTISDHESREDFMYRQKAEEFVCTVISRAVKSCL